MYVLVIKGLNIFFLDLYVRKYGIRCCRVYICINEFL